MNREQLKAIRPTIVVEKKPETELEKFQIEVLRPILKFQNELILELFANQIQKNKAQFQSLSFEQKFSFIHTLVKNNKAFQNTLIGVIIAFFTAPETSCYLQNSSEWNKRISAFIIQRIHSQV
ncbi:MAG: glyoxalase [Bacteroidota bacterium]